MAESLQNTGVIVWIYLLRHILELSVTELYLIGVVAGKSGLMRLISGKC